MKKDELYEYRCRWTIFAHFVIVKIAQRLFLTLETVFRGCSGAFEYITWSSSGKGVKTVLMEI